VSIKTVQSQKQQATVSTAMIQSLEILQMTDYELSEYIMEAAAENCMLDMERLNVTTPPVLVSESHHDFQKTPRKNSDENTEDSNEPSQSKNWLGSLETHLMLQLTQMKLSELQFALSRYFIHCIDSHGYLKEDPEATAQLLGVDIGEIEICIDRLRSLSPKGICAPDLRHCLLSQLDPVNDPPFIAEIIENHLDSLSRGHYVQISKKLGIGMNDVRLALGKIKTLNPFPAVGFESADAIEYIVPDVYITNENGTINISLRKSYSKILDICPYYKEMLERSQDADLTAYLDDKLKRARALIKNVSMRENTTMACIKSIVFLQKEYFNGQSKELLPMTLEDVAAHAKTHVSTVSRALKGKYLQYDGKVMSFRSLFSRKLGEKSNSGSAHLAKAMIRETISSEDKTCPLTDTAVCDLLKQRGFDISRRTVAKYREELNIPSALIRKQEER